MHVDRTPVKFVLIGSHNFYFTIFIKNERMPRLRTVVSVLSISTDTRDPDGMHLNA